MKKSMKERREEKKNEKRKRLCGHTGPSYHSTVLEVHTWHPVLAEPDKSRVSRGGGAGRGSWRRRRPGRPLSGPAEWGQCGGSRPPGRRQVQEKA